MGAAAAAEAVGSAREVVAAAGSATEAEAATGEWVAGAAAGASELVGLAVAAKAGAVDTGWEAVAGWAEVVEAAAGTEELRDILPPCHRPGRHIPQTPNSPSCMGNRDYRLHTEPCLRRNTLPLRRRRRPEG